MIKRINTEYIWLLVGDVKSILVVLGESYIGKGVESLLSRQPGLRVDSIPFLDSASLDYEIDTCQPNVIILDEGLISSKRIDLSNLLMGYPKIRLLVLGIHDNRLSIYDHQELIVSHSNDLVSAIERS
jgi:hypothetical protein